MILSTLLWTVSLSMSFAFDEGEVSRLIKKIQEPVKYTKEQLTESSTTEGRWWEARQKLCLQDELRAYEIERTVMKDWKRSLKKQDLKAFAQLLVEADPTSSLFAEPTGKPQLSDGISELKVDPKKIVKLESRLGEYSRVAGVELDLVDYVINFDDRDNQFQTKVVEGTLNFSVRGFDKNQQRRMDIGSAKVSFQWTKSGWRISKVRPIDGKILMSQRDPLFEDVTNQRGLASLPNYLRTEAIRRGGYALAMSDIDADGSQEMLVGGRDSLVLLKQDAEGRFKDITKGSGLEKVRFAKTAIFGDLRNNQIKDLIIITLIPGKKMQDAGQSSVLLFQGDGKGKFKQVENHFGSKKAMLQPMPAALADFNKDGFLDLYVGYPGIRDFTVLEDQKQTREMQGLYLNDGQGRFKDFTDHFKTAENSRDSNLFPHSAMAADIDQNGEMDLIVVDDRNNLSPVYMGAGKGVLQERAENIGLGNKGYGMSIAAGDVQNRGLTDLAWSNVNFYAAQRMGKACSRHWDMESRYSEDGLRLFSRLPGGYFEEATKRANLAGTVGQGAGGMTFIDYNNDGKQDIYLVNGLWSGHEDADDVAPLFITLLRAQNEKLRMGLKEDSIGFKGILQKFEGRISSTGKIERIKGQPINMLGHQFNRLLKNNGDGTYTDVAFFEGVDSTMDGYIVGTAVNSNGSEDLVLRNADPGTDAVVRDTFPVQFFKNRSSASNKSILLTFEGSRSNRDAFGTFVIADFGAQGKQIRHLLANTGSLQSEPVLRFVSPQGAKANLKIHWPSGRIQELKNVKPGKYHLKEPLEVLHSGL